MNTDELFAQLDAAYTALGHLAQDHTTGVINDEDYHTDHAAIHRHKDRVEESLRKAGVSKADIKAREQRWQREWVQMS